MKYQQYYGGIIWTNHAIDRMRNRGLSQEMAWEAFKKPDRFFKGKIKDTTEYQKKFDKSLVTIIAKQNEKKQWIVVSAWIDPPLPGSPDIKEREKYKAYQKAGFWKKLFITFKKQVGF